MSRVAALRGLLTPRSVPSTSCHFRPGHVYAARRLIHGSSKRPHEVLGTAAKQPEAEPIPVQKPNDKVTVNDIKERRAKAGKLVAGVAAYCDSDMFKAPVSSSVSIHKSMMSTNINSVSRKTKGQKMGSYVLTMHFPWKRVSFTNTVQIT